VTSTPSTTRRCSSSPPIACRRSTSSCPTRSRQGQGADGRCRTSGSAGWPSVSSCPTTCIGSTLEDRSRARRTNASRSKAARSSCKRLKPLPIEAVVRGYLIGSGWKDYQPPAVCGVELPPACAWPHSCPSPLFTPATKAAIGDHDENISYAQREALIGAASRPGARRRDRASTPRAPPTRVSRGIIIADTKFEFGLDPRRRSCPDRRGDDAGFVALLAGRPVPHRDQPAQLRQAVRARLSRNAGLEQDCTGTALPPTSSSVPATSTAKR
jgi:hypothetical protein